MSERERERVCVTERWQEKKRGNKQMKQAMDQRQRASIVLISYTHQRKAISMWSTTLLWMIFGHYSFNILKVTFDVEGRVHFLQIREMEENHKQPQNGIIRPPLTTGASPYIIFLTPLEYGNISYLDKIIYINHIIN